MEHSDQIFDAIEIYCGFAPDRAVYHSEKRGGDIDVADPAHIGRSRKPTEVAHHAAAKIKDIVLPACGVFCEKVIYHGQPIRALACFSIRQNYAFTSNGAGFKSRLYFVQKQRCNYCVCHNEDPVWGYCGCDRLNDLVDAV